jgi:hypothetical protein
MRSFSWATSSFGGQVMIVALRTVSSAGAGELLDRTPLLGVAIQGHSRA